MAGTIRIAAMKLNPGNNLRITRFSLGQEQTYQKKARQISAAQHHCPLMIPFLELLTIEARQKFMSKIPALPFLSGEEAALTRLGAPRMLSLLRYR
jgi:hypothetical protein